VTFEEARAQFPVLDRIAYLNAGTFGPLARATAEALEEQRRRDLEQGRSGAGYWEGLMEGREKLRARLASMLHVTPEQLALTGSTTDGCNVVLGGLGLGPGDEVVTTDVEHFGLLGPLHASGATVRVARIKERPAGEAFDAILAEVTPRTKLFALSHVAWSTGNVLPIAELKPETGVPILVDGAQSVGAIDVDAAAYDFYTVSGQKWLCGPEGTGALYVADPERLRLASPTSFGFVHDADPSLRPKPGAARFDTSWVGPGQIAGLEAALAAAPDWRFVRGLEQARRARERLGDVVDVVTERAQATLVTFRYEGDTAEAAKRIAEQGVVIRDMPGTGWLRASVGWWTSDEDLERLVAAL
jgi:L-cysteine/cystine lyase